MAREKIAKGKIAVRLMLIGVGFILLFMLIMQPFAIHRYHEQIVVLFPKGIVALEQRNLLFILQGIMLLVILPVYVLTFVFSWKYRSSNPKATYDPDLVDNRLAEVIWWGVPLILTGVVAVLTAYKTYELDPYRPLVSDKKPLHLQVVALDWKWLFIYPEEKIATVNFVPFPKEVPLHFEITSDAPMNSFWIPALGGQIYAMPKMKTELYLMANEEGEFRGSSANISGEGFSGMHFIASAMSEEGFQAWLEKAKASENVLNRETYRELRAPSKNHPTETYRLQDEKLFHEILM